jgi:hypothetical protein
VQLEPTPSSAAARLRAHQELDRSIVGGVPPRGDPRITITITARAGRSTRALERGTIVLHLATDNHGSCRPMEKSADAAHPFAAAGRRPTERSRHAS